MDKDKLLRKVQGLNPTKRSTESLSDEDKKRYRREVGRSPDDRLYYVSAEQEKKRNDIELDGAQRIVGANKEGKTVPDKIKSKVAGVRRTLKPSQK